MEKKEAPPQYLIEFYKFDPTSKVLFREIKTTSSAGVPMQELLKAFLDSGVMLPRNMTNFKILLGQESGIIKWDALKEFCIKFGPLFLCHEMIDNFIDDEAKKWYHGNIDAMEAEHIIEVERNKHPTETKTIFLVRAHKNPNTVLPATRSEKMNFFPAFMISYYNREKMYIEHITVFRNMRCYMINKDNGTVFCPSFQNILDHLKLNRDTGKAIASNSNISALVPSLKSTASRTPIVTLETELAQKNIVMKSERIDKCALEKKLIKDKDWVLLGKGTSHVYLAEYNNQLVALKKLIPLTYRPERILQVKSLSHPNLVSIIDFVEVNFQQTYDRYLVMELMDLNLYTQIGNVNCSPKQFWKNNGKNIALHVITALEYLHSFEIVHKDIKSPNIFIKIEEGQMVAKIGDIDNIRKVDKYYVCQTIEVMSPTWASPEQFQTTKLTVASDIYSFGVLLWEIATLKTPWDGFSNPVISGKVTTGKFLEVHKKELKNKQLVAIISQCCQVDLNRPTATEVKESILKLS